MEKPTLIDLERRAGISKSYACEILNGKRAPSRSLAIRIYRSTGWKPDVIAALSDDDIAVLERIEGLAA